LLILAQQFGHRRKVAGFILVRRATHLNFI
jgi:hypothetical protein